MTPIPEFCRHLSNRFFCSIISWTTLLRYCVKFSISLNTLAGIKLSLCNHIILPDGLSGTRLQRQSVLQPQHQLTYRRYPDALCGINISKDKHGYFILSSECEVLPDVFNIQNSAEGLTHFYKPFVAVHVHRTKQNNVIGYEFAKEYMVIFGKAKKRGFTHDHHT